MIQTHYILSRLAEQLAQLTPLRSHLAPYGDLTITVGRVIPVEDEALQTIATPSLQLGTSGDLITGQYEASQNGDILIRLMVSDGETTTDGLITSLCGYRRVEEAISYIIDAVEASEFGGDVEGITYSIETDRHPVWTGTVVVKLAVTQGLNYHPTLEE